jgi:hypothetical protein
MAGGRLTHDDRRSIETWLAAGVGFAEMGRRLGRPTSTISREVARNGHGAYSADRAQQATRRSVGHQVAERQPAELPPDPERQFIEEFAALLAATGMPRMASRVFTCLLTSPGGSLTAAELVRRLRVSPASVSKAIGYLEGMDLVGRESNPGARRERYVIDDDVWLRALRTDAGAHASVADASQRGIAIFGAHSPAGIRLGLMGQFFGGLTEQIRGSGLADPVIRDAMTVVAALAHVAQPLTARELGSALGWPLARTNEALDALGRQPALADPFTLAVTNDGYTIQPRPDRLSTVQREALRPAGDTLNR